MLFGDDALPTFVFHERFAVGAVEGNHLARAVAIAHGEQLLADRASRWYSRCQVR